MRRLVIILFLLGACSSNRFSEPITVDGNKCFQFSRDQGAVKDPINESGKELETGLYCKVAELPD